MVGTNGKKRENKFLIIGNKRKNTERIPKPRRVYALEVFANVYYVGNVEMTESTGGSMSKEKKDRLVNVIRQTHQNYDNLNELLSELAKEYVDTKDPYKEKRVPLQIDSYPRMDITDRVTEYRKRLNLNNEGDNK
tara:strand:+ start:316 stop:720 length:405 start_codon:yes stop_codon:yes gene_type:complete